jgi:hypothetical protein
MDRSQLRPFRDVAQADSVLDGLAKGSDGELGHRTRFAGSFVAPEFDNSKGHRS